MIKAVIFDVDNTLYSFTRAHEKAFGELLQYARQKLGMSEEFFRALHQKTEKELRTYMGEVAALHNRCIRYQVMLENQGLPLYPHVLKMNELYWETLLKAAVPSKGAEETMKGLRAQGVRIGIGTDMTARVQFQKLEALGLLSYIDFLVSSEEAGAEKPQAAFFDRCMKKAGCDRQECLFVGDNLKKDVQGAADAGLRALWYRPEGPKDQTDVPQIADLTELLQKLSVP